MITYLIVTTAIVTLALVVLTDYRVDLDEDIFKPVFIRLDESLPKEEIQKLYYLNEISKNEYEFTVAKKYGVPIS